MCMLTIGQLAAHAGVTVAAVRHYHKIGLLPEPERDHSGYRTYDAAAVVRLIRIHVLADAGVPLAQVEDLLDADPARFSDGVGEIDRRLAGEVDRLQETRGRLARLAAGDAIALPASVAGYLDRLRALGVEGRYLDMERDAWIMIAAQVPDQIEDIIAAKHRDLDDPAMVRLYVLLGHAPAWTADDPRLEEAADLLDRFLRRAEAAQEVPRGRLQRPVRRPARRHHARRRACRREAPHVAREARLARRLDPAATRPRRRSHSLAISDLLPRPRAAVCAARVFRLAFFAARVRGDPTKEHTMERNTP